jgi:replicative DNA helicase
VKIFNNLYNKIQTNLDKKEAGGITSIIPPFERLSKKYPGWVKGSYTLITSNSGIGKTKFSKFFAVTSVYDFVKKNPNIKTKIFYFALEESKEMFWLSMVSTMLYNRYNIYIAPQQLLSLGDYTLDRDILIKVHSIEAEVNDMEKYIEVIDNVFNPYGIYKRVRDYFTEDIGHFTKVKNDEGKDILGEFVYKDDDLYVFAITDQLNLLVPDSNGQYNAQKNLHEAMDYFSKEYSLKQMSKRLKCVVINIQQQAADKEKQEFYKGQSIEKKLEPSLDGLGDNRLTARDADMVLGLFAPTRYELNTYRGYNVDRLKDKMRTIIVLKDRHYGIANSYIHLYFNGATNTFKELPLLKDMTEETYQQIEQNKY